MATAPRSCAGVEPKAPLNDPTGVRFALAMTISESGMSVSLRGKNEPGVMVGSFLHDPSRIAPPFYIISVADMFSRDAERLRTRHAIWRGGYDFVPPRVT